LWVRFPLRARKLLFGKGAEWIHPGNFREGLAL